MLYGLLYGLVALADDPRSESVRDKNKKDITQTVQETNDILEIDGCRIQIFRTLSGNKNAVIRLREGNLHLVIPSRWSQKDRKEIGDRLVEKAIKAITNGRWKEREIKNLVFRDGQSFMVLGKKYDIKVLEEPGVRFKAKIHGEGTIILNAPEHQNREKIISIHVKRIITKTIATELERRIEKINSAHFGSAISAIKVRENKSTWGSCSSKNSISINLKLLFMPPEILDYVIVHELAHTKYRGHGKRFWQIVEKIMPNYKEKRRWLREKGYSFVPDDATREENGDWQTDLSAQQTDITGWIAEELSFD